MFVPWSTMWRLEDNWVVNFLLHHVGSRDQSQVVRLEGRYLYPLNHLAGSNTWLFTCVQRIKHRFLYLMANTSLSVLLSL